MYWTSHAQKENRIAGRYSHSSVVHGDSMFIFGGGTFEATNFNDLWRFDLSTRTYIRPLSTGSYPPPKSCASFLSHGRKLILFGGWRHNSNSWPQRECVLYNQLHVYDVPGNKWTLVSGGQSDQLEDNPCAPPTLAKHSATVANDEMIVFGGIQRYGVMSTYSNEVWRLNLLTYKWIKQKTSEPQPQPRYGQGQVQLDPNNVLIIGGCGGPNNIFRDAWLLTRPQTEARNAVWTWRQVTIRASLKSGPSPTVHVWCNSVCLVGDKLVVLGPIRANDFQMVRETNQSQQPAPRMAPNDNNRPASPPPVFQRPAVVAAAVAAAIPQLGEHHRLVREYNNRVDEERHRLDVEHENILLRMRRFRRGERQGHAGMRQPREPPMIGANGLMNMPWGRRAGAVRLAAFQDDANNNGAAPPVVVAERVSPRLEEAHQVLVRGVNRRLNENQGQGHDWNGVLRGAAPAAEPAAALVRPDDQRTTVNKTKVMAMHVCDLSRVLTTGDDDPPVMTWLDPPGNLGCFDGAPEKVIMYSLVAGKGELIMFGGLVKETNSQEVDDLSKVSNGLHFLTVPKRVI